MPAGKLRTLARTPARRNGDPGSRRSSPFPAAASPVCNIFNTSRVCCDANEARGGVSLPSRYGRQTICAVSSGTLVASKGGRRFVRAAEQAERGEAADAAGDGMENCLVVGRVFSGCRTGDAAMKFSPVAIDSSGYGGSAGSEILAGCRWPSATCEPAWA